MQPTSNLYHIDGLAFKAIFVITSCQDQTDQFPQQL